MILPHTSEQVFLGEWYWARLLWGRSEKHTPRCVRSQAGKVNVKGDGQECPSYTGNINIKTNLNCKNDGQECPSHTD